MFVLEILELTSHNVKLLQLDGRGVKKDPNIKAGVGLGAEEGRFACSDVLRLQPIDYINLKTSLLLLTTEKGS